MPLRDHFRPPLTRKWSWDNLHGLWPGAIVFDLFQRLPPRYVAAPTFHLGGLGQIDVVGFDYEPADSFGSAGGADSGGTATAAWAPPQPTLDVAAELPEQDEYEVRVYDLEQDRRLVAAVEILSPSNKDRPENRRAFVGKCEVLFGHRVTVAIIDLVTIRHFNLYTELLDLLGQADPSQPEDPATIYTAVCRFTGQKDAVRFKTWAHALGLGQPLPTLPLWLTDTFAVPLELEPTYERTCLTLRMP